MTTEQSALPQTDSPQNKQAAFRPKSVLLMQFFREVRALEGERRARLLALSVVPRV